MADWLALTLSGAGAQVSHVQLTGRSLAAQIDERAEISNLWAGEEKTKVAIKCKDRERKRGRGGRKGWK